MQKITEPHCALAAPPITLDQLNRLDDEARSLGALLRLPAADADFNRIVDACNALRYACLGTAPGSSTSGWVSTTETEQFEADGADKILASIAALRAIADMPAVDYSWRVGEFANSARRSENVLMLAVGRRQIAEYGMHGDFIRWIATSVSALRVDKSTDLHGDQVDKTADSHERVVDAEFPGTPTIAECIAQLDVWNGHLETAIDRQAHEALGQHANDEPAAGGRDPMEQFP